MSTEPIVFDSLTPVEVPVTIAGESYTLREATGETAVQYRDAMLACTTLGPEGKPTIISGLAGVEPLLVSLCLYDSIDHLVPEATIRSWPARIQKALFERAKQISDLDEGEDEDEDEESVKN